MNIDLYTLEPQYWEDDTKARDYNHEDDIPVTKEDAMYLIKHNVNKITILVEDEDIDEDDNGDLFIQVENDDASMFTVFMDLVAIAYPSIDQTYFRELDEVMECTYVPEEDVHIANKKIKIMIDEIKAK